MLLVVVAVVVVAGIVIALFGWDRYRGNRNAAGDGGAAQPTAEVFVDPDTGRRMRVWYDRDTGRREYRPEQPANAALGVGVAAAGPGTDREDRQKDAPPAGDTMIKVTGLS